MGLVPDTGRSHKPQGNWALVPQLLSLHSLDPMLYSKRSHHHEEPLLSTIKSSLHSLQPEKSAWSSKDPPTAAAAKSLQSCLTLCDPTDGSPPGSPVPGILQARVLEWGAIAFSSAWKSKVKVKSLSRVRLLATPWTAAHQAPPSVGFSRQEYWSGVPLPSLRPPTATNKKKIFFKFNPGHLLIPLDTVGHWTLSGAFCQPPVFKAPFD